MLQHKNTAGDCPASKSDSVPAGQHERFAELMVRNQNRLYRYVCSLIPNRADAEEIFQEVNLTLWKTWERFDLGRDFLPWAFTIARNQIRNFRRKRENHLGLLGPEIMEQLSDTILKHDELLVEQTKALAGCVEKLSPEQRQLLERCYMGEQDIRDVAASIGNTCNAVYKRLGRIRVSLHHCISYCLRRSAQG
jgi:RNA polymerase sigma-70 factor (ECF subfamily)